MVVVVVVFVTTCISLISLASINPFESLLTAGSPTHRIKGSGLGNRRGDSRGPASSRFDIVDICGTSKKPNTPELVVIKGDEAGHY